MLESSQELFNRYITLAEEYLFSAKMLLEKFEEVSIDPMGHNKTRPLFMLISHSCECFLKAYIIKTCPELNEKELVNKYGHDLTKMMRFLDGVISEEVKELIFYLASSHYTRNGSGSSHSLRYNDNKFDSKKHDDLRKLLLKKQNKFGYSAKEPIFIGQATPEQKQQLEPELSSYSKFLFSNTQMRPYPSFALETLDEGIVKLKVSFKEKVA